MAFASKSLIAGTIAVLSFSAISASAGDSWNIPEPSLESRSVEASADLFDGAAAMFAGLAQSERQNRVVPDHFIEAATSLDEAAATFEILAVSDFADRLFSFADLQLGDQLYDWAKQVRSGDIHDIHNVTVGEMLMAAATEAHNLSAVMQQVARDPTYPNSLRARFMIDRYTRFLSVGTVAAVRFARMNR
ncbi:MAG: hypothetical protein ACOH2J_04230 [Allorhizobium sp.]